jgi:hypothetical protein
MGVSDDSKVHNILGPFLTMVAPYTLDGPSEQDTKSHSVPIEPPANLRAEGEAYNARDYDAPHKVNEEAGPTSPEKDQKKPDMEDQGYDGDADSDNQQEKQPGQDQENRPSEKRRYRRSGEGSICCQKFFKALWFWIHVYFAVCALLLFTGYWKDEDESVRTWAKVTIIGYAIANTLTALSCCYLLTKVGDAVESFGDNILKGLTSSFVLCCTANVIIYIWIACYTFLTATFVIYGCITLEHHKNTLESNKDVRPWS